LCPRRFFIAASSAKSDLQAARASEAGGTFRAGIFAINLSAKAANA
jgi:hypothetical protein